jgi:hypothetical protein
MRGVWIGIAIAIPLWVGLIALVISFRSYL